MVCSLRYWAFAFGILFTVLVGISGHGRLVDPPSRVSGWRYGCTSCAQASQHMALYTDTQWNCGGMGHQWDSQNGACGICGDRADGPYESEAGGIYATGTIVRTYTKGATIEVKAEITASHLGYIVFKLCPVNNMHVRATQECFDKYPLARSDGKGIRTYIPQLQKVYTVEVVLPADLTCTQCVMQWDYWTENRWGDCGNGTGMLGCGPQEQFRACADVSISDDGNPVTNPPGTAPPSPPSTEAPTPAPTTKAPTTQAPTTRPSTTTTPPPTCKAKTKCTKKKGSCIPTSTTCNGKVLKKGCKTSDCQCCVSCQQANKCIKSGGSCIGPKATCNGKVLKKKCNKKDKCQCCKPYPTTSAPTLPPTTTGPTTPAPPPVLGCPIFKQSHSWQDNIQGDLHLSFPDTVASWNLELTFDISLDWFQVYIMQKDAESGTQITLTPFNWNSAQEAGRSLTVFIWIRFTGSQTPQLTSAKLSGRELC